MARQRETSSTLEHAKATQILTRGNSSKTNTHFKHNVKTSEYKIHTPSHTGAAEPVKTVPPNGGRLKYFLPQREKLTRDPCTLGRIRGYKIPLLETPYQSKIQNKLGITAEHGLILSKEVSCMLEMGVIQKANHTKGGIISNAFLRLLPWLKSPKMSFSVFYVD